MNVLIYSGEGTSVDSVRQTKSFLSGLLSPYYAVSVVTKQQLLEEPWMGVTSLLVIPGGADIPYCRALNGPGNKRIQQFVRKGGRYLGLCAGAYYATKAIEFERGTAIEVSEPRELGLYNGVARGTVFKGFVYGSDKGSHATELVYLDQNNQKQSTVAYFNGGCLFEGDKDAEVLARYSGPVDIDSDSANPAAIVFKEYGEGKVLLSGVHFEYDLDLKTVHQRDISPEVVTRIYEARQSRQALVEYLIGDKLGLNVSRGGQKAVPRLTPLHLTSLSGSSPSVSQLINDLKPVIGEDGVLKGNEDHSFKFIAANDTSNGFGNVEESQKIVYVHEQDVPEPQETPFFNHRIYFAELSSCIEQMGRLNQSHVGSLLLYGEVVTSTTTMLEQTPSLLSRAPNGLAVVATQQIAGRGRGSNVWVNPVGVMAVTGVIRIPQSQCRQSLVFLQYIASLALVRAVNSFLPPSTDIGLRVKWPNDVYLVMDSSNHDKSLEKVNGVNISCTASGGDYMIIFGSGTNVDNPYPTTSINSRISELNAGPQIQLERLLARFLTTFDDMVQRFLVSGFGIFKQEYLNVWLHTNAQVTLERYGNVKASVKGISSDTGMLVAEDPDGVSYELQPDGNSFDMLRGLIRRKT